MSTRFYTPSAPVALTLNLEDGNEDQFPRAFIFSNGSIITSVDLGHVGLGRYSGTWIPGALKSYDALFVIYSEVTHTTESDIYTREMERWQSQEIIADAIGLSSLPIDIADQVWDELLAAHTLAGSAGEYLARLTQGHVDTVQDTNVRAVLLEKILRNRLELADGSTDNWVLYDDDSVTPLLRWSVTDKEGSGIAQQRLVPSRRTRGA